MNRARSLLPFVGGLLGPFGTGVVTPMLPELRDEFLISTEAASLTFTLYFLPFALLLIFSGTIGERFGRQRALRLAFATYGVASLICFVAPSLGILLSGRLLQGAANAFITPLLLAGLVEVAAEAVVGRVVGLYGLFQALGGLMAPLVGGIAADINWRLAFLVVGVVSFLLIPSSPPGQPNPEATPPSLRSLATRRMGYLSAGACLMAFGPIGAGIIVGLKLRDDIGLDGATTGRVFVVGSAVAMLVSPLAGRLMDRLGVTRVTLAASALSILAVLWLGATDSQIGVVGAWALAAAAAIAITVVFQALAAGAVPGNRGGAISAMLACRFLGHGLGPVAWTPLMANHATLAFVGTASVGLPAMAFLLLAGKSGRA